MNCYRSFVHGTLVYHVCHSLNSISFEQQYDMVQSLCSPDRICCEMVYHCVIGKMGRDAISWLREMGCIDI